MTKEQLKKDFSFWLDVKNRAILISENHDKIKQAYDTSLQATGYVELAMCLEIIDNEEYKLLLEKLNSYRVLFGTILELKD